MKHRPTRIPHSLEDLLHQRDKLDIEESMVELNKFNNRLGKKKVFAGSPRIYIEEVLKIK